MRENAPDVLWDEAWGKIVLLYLGCKLNQIDCSSIKELVNKVTLAGTSGKKLTFSNRHNVFETEELMKFVEDYTYQRMEYFLYHQDKLDVDIMRRCEDWESEKSMFFHLLEIIYDTKFLDEIDHADVWLALEQSVHIKFGTAAYMNYIPKNSSRCRFDKLIQKAILDYDDIINHKKM